MDKKLKAKWVKALMSGKYKQGHGALYAPKDGSFCCLGVLCVVAGAKPMELDGMGYPEDTGKFTGLIVHEDAKQLARLNDNRVSEGGAVPFEILAGLIKEAL